MNYFAHGRRFIDEPYFLAGTALPDWLSAVDRKIRLRPKSVALFIDDPDPQVAALARGVAQHHADDAWFHATAVFTELSWQLTDLVRGVVPDDEGFRPSFLGHILVELLLDARLIADDPARLDAYYAALETLDGLAIEVAVNRMAAPRETTRLAELLPLFSQSRFLSDYAEDGRLWFRLNQVLGRVRQPPLPEAFREILPTARRLVDPRITELLTEIPR